MEASASFPAPSSAASPRSFDRSPRRIERTKSEIRNAKSLQVFHALRKASGVPPQYYPDLIIRNHLAVVAAGQVAESRRIDVEGDPPHAAVAKRELTDRRVIAAEHHIRR